MTKVLPTGPAFRITLQNMEASLPQGWNSPEPGEDPMISGGGARMRNRIREWGQGLVEYGLILLLIALVVLVALTVFGQSVSSLYSQVVSSWP